MGKVKFFKCPKCGTLLQIKVELPENNVSWPFVIHYRHLSPQKEPCDIVLALDPNYDIREIGKEGLDVAQKQVENEEQASEDKKLEDLGFKVIKE